jgi:hypothetical protein
MRKRTPVGAFEFLAFVSGAGYQWVRGRAFFRETEPPPGALLRLEKVKPPVGWYLVPRAVPGSATNPQRPLEDHTGLFRDFAQLSPDRDAILAFANVHGPLLNLSYLVVPADVRGKLKSSSARPGESLKDWIAAISDMKVLVKFWQAIVDRDIDTLSRFVEWSRDRVLYVSPGSKKGAVLASSEVRPDTFARLQKNDLLLPARLVLRFELNERLARSSATTRPHLLLMANTDIRLSLCPANLLAALWLQFAQAFASNHELVACRGCGKFFQVGAGSKRRADATTCSDACRQRAHRREANGGKQR